ncbi:MAG: hypothetical protein WC829_03820 [Hyphomicrobium sp.]|jgi:hypothetical protein
MSHAGKLPPPPSWGDDELTSFLQSAHQNQYATFLGKRDAVAKLVAIDGLFARVTKDWINPPSQILAMLFIRCVGAYRTACSLAMSGQAAECYLQCRSVLEYAAYAVHINRNPTLGEVWLDRHVDEEGIRSSKRAFLHVAVLDSVKAANRHAAQRFEAIYQLTIDLGAHPNERAVTANIQMTEEADRWQMLGILLHGDGVQLDMALKTVAQCGMVGLELFETVYGAKFQLLGIKSGMLSLRRRGI